MSNLGKNILKTILPLIPHVSAEDFEPEGKHEDIVNNLNNVIGCYIAELKTDMQYELRMAAQFCVSEDESESDTIIEDVAETGIVIPDFTSSIQIGGLKNCGEATQYNFEFNK